jgi:CRP-like cAMP-binding protein
LGKVPIFQELPRETLADLSKRVWQKQAEAGSVIVSQEDAGDALFVIAKGRVKVVLYGETGREIILSMLKAGDFFGEMSLLDRQPRSANVVRSRIPSCSAWIGRRSRPTSWPTPRRR